MDLAQAYALLGFEPLEIFMSKKVGENLEHLTKTLGPQNLADKNSPSYRQIGASTWMCCSAAMRLWQGSHVLLGGVEQEAERLAILTRDIAHKLYGVWPGTTEEKRFVYPSGVKLQWSYGKRIAGVVGFAGHLHDDTLWKERAIALIQGPFALIHHIEKTGDVYTGYSREREVLMALTEEGAVEYMLTNPEVRFYDNGDPAPTQTESRMFAAGDFRIPSPVPRLNFPKKPRPLGLRGALTRDSAPLVTTRGQSGTGPCGKDRNR